MNLLLAGLGNERFGLLDEHDGDVVFDLVKKPAFFTDQTVSRFI